MIQLIFTNLFLLSSVFIFRFRDLRPHYSGSSHIHCVVSPQLAIFFILNFNRLMLSFIPIRHFYFLTNFFLVLEQILFLYFINFLLISFFSTENHFILCILFLVASLLHCLYVLLSVFLVYLSRISLSILRFFSCFPPLLFGLLLHPKTVYLS